MWKLFNTHPLITFFVLAYLYSWLGGFLLLGGIIQPFGEWPIMMDSQQIAKVRLWRSLIIWGPNFAAITVLGLTKGRKAIKKLFFQFLKWDVGGRWWCAAILTPLGLALLSICLYQLSGKSLDTQNIHVLPFIFFILLSHSLTESGIGEEAGWRGFALPQLQQHYGALVSSLIIGIVWAFWHTPLFFCA